MPTKKTTTTKKTKTKEDLMDDIRRKNHEISELKEKVKNLERYEKYDEMADETKAIYDSFIRSGFTEDQAFTLLGQFINAAGNMIKPRFPF